MGAKTHPSTLALIEGMRAARLGRGLTQAELALAVGISRGTVASIEGGWHQPSLDTAVRIMIVLDMWRPTRTKCPVCPLRAPQ